MIVQDVPEGETPVIIRNVDHADTAAQLARAFGNGTFIVPEPVELLHYVTENHEEGWRPYDDNPVRNPLTGLPYMTAYSPQWILIEKSMTSPDHNGKRHPWCGLLSSMHNYGLYNNRYGINDKVTISSRPAEYVASIRAMEFYEIARQERLKELLRRDPETASWAEKERLFASYALLEFYDTLALFFQDTHNDLRETATFVNIPVRAGETATLTVTPAGPQRARVTPYPFHADPLIVTCQVRKFAPCDTDEEFTHRIKEAAYETETYTLVS
jgi:hypothetical protein